MTETEDESKGMNILLSKVEKVNLREKCISMGWRPKNGKDRSSEPPQKNYIVAISDELIETWYPDGILDVLSSHEIIRSLNIWCLKELLRDSAIAMGHPEIICRDERFIKNLYKQFRCALLLSIN